MLPQLRQPCTDFVAGNMAWDRGANGRGPQSGHTGRASERPLPVQAGFSGQDSKAGGEHGSAQHKNVPTARVVARPARGAVGANAAAEPATAATRAERNMADSDKRAWRLDP